MSEYQHPSHPPSHLALGTRAPSCPQPDLLLDQGPCARLFLNHEDNQEVLYNPGEGQPHS